jgi:hypothetical protein
MTDESHPQPTLAETVQAEDLACGDYVALLSETVEFPSFFWDCCGAALSPHELVRLKIVPAGAGIPLKVLAICLPFVYAKTPSGTIQIIDLRKAQLIRLDRDCAKLVWKELKPELGR